MHTNRLIANIEKVYKQAKPSEIESGKLWYISAREQGQALSDEFEITLEQACSVIACLSPNNNWTRNLADAWKVCRAWQACKLETRLGHWKQDLRDNCKTCTYPANRAKAFLILDGNCSALSGQKVCTFAANMLGNTSPVTIDTHALSICHGQRYTVKSVPVISKSEYRQATLAYQIVAKRNNLTPCDLQAIVWQVHRRIHGLVSAKETARLF